MLNLMLILTSVLCSLSSTVCEEDPGISCETTCRYQEYAKDAECTDRGLNRIPSGCRGAHNFDITFNNLTSLTVNSLQGFFQLRYLHVEENQIATIQAGVFLPVRRTLRMLNISSNRIRQLADDTFVNLTRLEFLLLSDNQISTISSGAFRGMTRLSQLYLGNNHISTLDPTIFYEMPRLTLVNLRNNNLQTFDLSFLGALPLMRKIFVHRNALTEITGKVSIQHNQLILLNFSSNNISSFDCSTLQNLDHLLNVYLGSNSLQTVTNCHTQYHLSVLRMSENPFHCDCNLRALQQWLQQHPDYPSPVCATPENVRNEEVRNLGLDCPEDDELIGTTHLMLLDGFHEEGTTPQLDLPKHPATLIAATKKLDILKTDNPGHLATILKVNHGSGIPDEDLGEYEEWLFSKGNTTVFDASLIAVLVSIVIVFIIVVVLFIVILKNYCSPPEIDDSSSWSSKYPHQTDAETEEGDIANENTPAIGHHYEKIKEKEGQTALRMPRQLSIDTDTSETNILPLTPDSGVFPYNNSICDSDENFCNCNRCNLPDHEQIYSSSLSQYNSSKYSSSDSDYPFQEYHPPPPPIPVRSLVGDTSPYISHTSV